MSTLNTLGLPFRAHTQLWELGLGGAWSASAQIVIPANGVGLWRIQALVSFAVIEAVRITTDTSMLVNLGDYGTQFAAGGLTPLSRVDRSTSLFAQGFAGAAPVPAAPKIAAVANAIAGIDVEALGGQWYEVGTLNRFDVWTANVAGTMSVTLFGWGL